MAILIRPETSDDIPTIRTVHERAFGQSIEADIVDRLRDSCDVLVSLVAVSDPPAEPDSDADPPAGPGAVGGRSRSPSIVDRRVDGQVVGHILFSPVTVDGDRGTITGMGLAPMGVLPECQRRGIGSALVEHGLAAVGRLGCPFVVVLGHPGYYPRFGFESASTYGLVSQWDGVPDEAFMVVVLDPDAMSGVRGVARYRDEFDEAM